MNTFILYFHIIRGEQHNMSADKMHPMVYHFLTHVLQSNHFIYIYFGALTAKREKQKIYSNNNSKIRCFVKPINWIVNCLSNAANVVDNNSLDRAN